MVDVPVDVMKCGRGPVELMFEVGQLMLQSCCFPQFIGCVASDGFGSDVQVVAVGQSDGGGWALHLLELCCGKMVGLHVELRCKRQSVAFLGVVLMAFDVVQHVFQRREVLVCLL